MHAVKSYWNSFGGGSKSESKSYERKTFKTGEQSDKYEWKGRNFSSELLVIILLEVLIITGPVHHCGVIRKKC